MSGSYRLPKKYKWALDVPYLRTWFFYTGKLRKTAGGYMEASGKPYIGRGVRLIPIAQFYQENAGPALSFYSLSRDEIVWLWLKKVALSGAIAVSLSSLIIVLQ